VSTSTSAPSPGTSAAASWKTSTSVSDLPSEYCSSATWPARTTRVAFVVVFAAVALDRYARSMVRHHCAAEGVALVGTDVRERRKSTTMAFCAGLNCPYQTMETRISPRSTAPPWYEMPSPSAVTSPSQSGCRRAPRVDSDRLARTSATVSSVLASNRLLEAIVLMLFQSYSKGVEISDHYSTLV
jgi:hypothetical protein